MFHEYPKALYRNGEYTAVANAEEEVAMRVDGWAGWHADQDAMNKVNEQIDDVAEIAQSYSGARRGPKPKVK